MLPQQLQPHRPRQSFPAQPASSSKPQQKKVKMLFIPAAASLSSHNKPGVRTLQVDSFFAPLWWLWCMTVAVRMKCDNLLCALLIPKGVISPSIVWDVNAVHMIRCLLSIVCVICPWSTCSVQIKMQNRVLSEMGAFWITNIAMLCSLRDYDMFSGHFYDVSFIKF